MKRLIYTLFAFLCILLLTPSKSMAQATTGLVGYWSFDDSTAKDNSGNGHNGITSGSPSAVKGISGNAMYFNGSTDYAVIPNSAALNFGTSGKMTISLWMKIDSLDNNYTKIRPFFSKSGGSSTLSDYILLLEDFGGNPKLKWGTGDASDTASWMLVKEPSHNKWHHIVATMDNVSRGGVTVYPKRLYIDCKLIKSDTAYIKADSQTNDLVIGALYSLKTYQNEYFHGALDEIRLYNRALNDSEITDLCTIHSKSTTLSGKVSTSGATALKSSKVYLIRFNPADTTISALDSVVTDSLGNYSFTIGSDTLLYLLADPDSATYPHEVATYYDSAFGFGSAAGIHIHSGTNIINFNTLSGSNTGGLGSISGKISLCTICKNSTTGLPAKHLKVILTNDNGKVQAITFTDNNGNFIFKKLALLKYHVNVDKPFVDNSNAPVVNLNESVTKSNLEFTLYRTYLELNAASGIETVPNKENEANVYPNPASEIFTIAYNTQKGGKILIQISDLMGREFSSISESAPGPGNYSRSIDARQLKLSSGIYQIKITLENKIIIKSIIINSK